MSNLSWSPEAEKSFINGLGTHSQRGALMGRLACLKSYRVALLKRSPDTGIDLAETRKLVDDAISQCLGVENVNPRRRAA